MKKVQTQLINFRFNQKHQKTSFTVEWFYYDLNDQLEENIRAFSNYEANLFIDYTVANPGNFTGPKNVWKAEEADIPLEDIMDLVPDVRLTHPACLILKPNCIVPT